MFRTLASMVLLAGLLLPVKSSAEQSQDLVSKAATQAEVSGTWQGRAETLVVDNFQAGTSRERLFLHTSRETLEL